MCYRLVTAQKSTAGQLAQILMDSNTYVQILPDFYE